MSAVRDISLPDKNRIVNILAAQAAASSVSPQAFFKDLVRRSNLPALWEQQMAGVWTGSANLDARNLVTWAVAKGGNPQDHCYSTLGSILSELLSDLGVEEGRWTSATIIAYDLYLCDELRRDLMLRYQIPAQVQSVPTDTMSGQLSDWPTGEAELPPIGPDIAWGGPTDQIELQSFFHPQPAVLDVGFLMRAIQSAAAVCRIELPTLNRSATGFLVGSDLLLTNYHVLKYTEAEDLETNARAALFQFGKTSMVSGQPAEGWTFHANSAQPVLKSSPVSKLDYVLLRLEDALKGASEEIKTATFSTEPLHRRMSLNILQHPGGDTLKLALSDNGVVDVLEESGLVQYTTSARGGSSGSPCFNDEWKVVALHHAERSRSFGVVREGILFRAIHDEIAGLL